MGDKNRFLAELRSKETLILHDYDTFVEKQTRLPFTDSLSGLRDWEEVVSKRKILMIEDITIFSIAGRRLIDLCKLQSATDSIKVRQIRLLDENSDLQMSYLDQNSIGFYAILSRIVHLNYFFYHDSKRDFKASMISDTISRYQAFIAPLRDDDKVDGFILMKDNKNGAVAIKLVDVINASIEAAEKIIEVCSLAKIHLESYVRNP